MSKKAKAVKKSVTTSSNGTQKITLLVKENPKRAGSDSHKRYELYKKHHTVADFLKAGGQRSDLGWDEKHKFIKIGA